MITLVCVIINDKKMRKHLELYLIVIYIYIYIDVYVCRNNSRLVD